MGVSVLTDCLVSINSVNLSTRVKKVTLNYSKEIHEATAMGDTGRRRVVGLADWSADIEFYRDEAGSNVIQTLWPLVGVQTAVAIRAVDDTIGGTNAEYQGNGMLEALPVLDADVTGGAAMTPVRFVGSDGVALVRDVT